MQKKCKQSRNSTQLGLVESEFNSLSSLGAKSISILRSLKVENEILGDSSVTLRIATHKINLILFLERDAIL